MLHLLLVLLALSVLSGVLFLGLIVVLMLLLFPIAESDSASSKAREEREGSDMLKAQELALSSRARGQGLRGA